MGSLLELYKDKCSIPSWKEKFSSIGREGHGAMFKLFNTNFRYLQTFTSAYQSFYSLTYNKPRKDWEGATNTGQELAKHYVTRMLQGKLFSKDKEYFFPTQKGKVLGSFLKGYSSEEVELLNLMLLLDGYFDYVVNYFIELASDVLQNFFRAGYSYSDIDIAIDEILRAKPSRMVNLFKTDYVFLDAFYADEDLLHCFRTATESDKTELKEYVTDNYLNKNFDDVISKKFQPGGNMTIGTVLSNAKVLFLVGKLIDTNTMQCRKLSFEEYCDVMIRHYSKYNVIDVDKIHRTIAIYRNIFEAVYNNLIGVNDIDNISENLFDDEEMLPRNKIDSIDSTDAKQQKELRKVSSILKRMAKEKTDYKCACEDAFSCNDHYFTSKESGHNYLEVHHLIPYEFRNDFEQSIELLENYVPLCPHCHRLIHFGVDRERVTVLNVLFRRREKELKAKGINIDLKVLREYYHFDTNKVRETSIFYDRKNYKDDIKLAAEPVK